MNSVDKFNQSRFAIATDCAQSLQLGSVHHSPSIGVRNLSCFFVFHRFVVMQRRHINYMAKITVI
ncbi:MAG: hypothetical protein WBG63_06750, partial [Phormidesmis sp.]